MKYINRQGFIQESNKWYGVILGNERRRRGISLEKLSSGILSRTTLDNIEKGKAECCKLAGDTLMLRMGISPDYFESLASGEELDRWRLREDICLLVSVSPGEAVAKLAEYRKKYGKREPIEEQFLLKVESLLVLAEDIGKRRKEGEYEGIGAGSRAEAALDMARRAVACTVKGSWEEKLDSLWLSPGELEAILLVGAALSGCDRKEEAWALWQFVWNYPQKHKWREWIAAMILPQAAILGIELSEARESERMLGLGREALELLRRNRLHCYVLPLLDCLCRLEAEESGEREYLEQARRFRDMFQEIYALFDYPGYRIWQGLSVDNTREAGLTLRMLRRFHGKSRKNAVYDGTGQVITPRQLEKIEKGIHKPSYENYGRLIKQYGKYVEWNMPLLETASADDLELRQHISTRIELRDWERAQWEIERLRSTMNPRHPRVKQELLFCDALLKWGRDGASAQCLDMMLEALRCTIPDLVNKDMSWWVFQREEIMIASSLAILYRRLGRLEESKKWFEAVISSVEQGSARTGIYQYGFEILWEGYNELLCELRRIDQALRMGEETIHRLLMLPRINNIQRMFYYIAGNIVEVATDEPEEYEILRDKWKRAFQISETMADFMLDNDFKLFQEERRTV
ncbi:MAG: hypothetical protein NC543_06370 [bacterium]|nr:hypothetical protein [bacterium]